MTSFLCLEKLAITSALRLQAILNSEITKKRYNNTKNVALNRPWKEHLFTVWELKQKRQSVTLFELSWECACQVTQIFCFSSKMTFKMPHVLIWGLRVNFSE